MVGNYDLRSILGSQERGAGSIPATGIMNTTQKIMVVIATLFYAQAWFDVAVHAYSNALVSGLVMFTLMIGASHVKALDVS